MLKRLAIVCLILWFTSIWSGAQVQPQVGTPPFSSVGGGSLDAINLGNLNVHLEFPIFSRPGRGVAFNYRLKYDSSIYALVGTVPSQSWAPATNWGWSNQTDGLLGQISYSVSQTKCFDGPDWYWGQRRTNFRYIDGEGIHYFPGSYVPCQDSPLPAISTTGSGYTLDFAAQTVTFRSCG